MTQAISLVHVDTCRDVIEAITECARFGQTLAGARRQVEMAQAEVDEATIAYNQAQMVLAKAVRAARYACGEPVGL